MNLETVLYKIRKGESSFWRKVKRILHFAIIFNFSAPRIVFRPIYEKTEFLKNCLRLFKNKYVPFYTIGFFYQTLILIFIIPLANANSPPAEFPLPLYVGWASVDITPTKPVALAGQMHKRISKSVHDPLYATVLALETRREDGEKEQAILISCDLLFVPRSTQEKLKELVKTRLPDFNIEKLFMNATHTHTGPLTQETYARWFDMSQDEGLLQPAEYKDFFLARVTDGVVQAWQTRRPGGVSWALGQAVIGYNRRAVYADGRSVMYGSTADPGFRYIEGPEDHGLELLFFWNKEEKLTGLVINVACPAQVSERENFVSADFWHEIREEIRKKYGEGTFVLPQVAAAGDQSPHLRWRKKAEQIMLQRKGISRRQEIALRIVRGIEEVLPYAKNDIKTQLVFKHTTVRIDLPIRTPPSPPAGDVDPVPIEVHILRLEEIAMATNPFELFLDYGIRIKARSKATLTLVVQLSSQKNGYLPTARAVKGGGYSAERYLVDPEGGDVLVDETVKHINAMWEP